MYGDIIDMVLDPILELFPDLSADLGDRHCIPS